MFSHCIRGRDSAGVGNRRRYGSDLCRLEIHAAIKIARTEQIKGRGKPARFYAYQFFTARHDGIYRAGGF